MKACCGLDFISRCRALASALNRYTGDSEIMCSYDMRWFIITFTRGPPSDHTAHETAMCHNPPIHNFTGSTLKTWLILNRPTLKHVMFLWKYKDKQLICGHILTEGVFVTQLTSDVGMSDKLCGLQQAATSRAIYRASCIQPTHSTSLRKHFYIGGGVVQLVHWLGHGLECQGSIPGWGKRSFFSKNRQTGSGTHPNP
jgi:hypothetical protein